MSALGSRMESVQEMEVRAPWAVGAFLPGLQCGGQVALGLTSSNVKQHPVWVCTAACSKVVQTLSVHVFALFF